MCICFCHYVEQQLQELHDDAQVMVSRLLDSQQQQQQDNNMQHEQQQQQQSMLANGDHSLNNGSWGPAAGQQQPHKQMVPGAAANGSVTPPGMGQHRSSSYGQQQWQETEQLSQAAAAKLRLLERRIADFSSLRREWVLKLGKAAAMGFMQHASGEGAASNGISFGRQGLSSPLLCRVCE